MESPHTAPLPSASTVRMRCGKWCGWTKRTTPSALHPYIHGRMHGRYLHGRQAYTGHRAGQGEFATDLATLLYPVCVWCRGSIYRERRYDALLEKHKSVNINGLTPSTTGIFPLHRGRKTRFSFPCKGKNTHSEQ